MKAITIRQPYAQLIVRGLKRYETRSFATKFRGALAIHAGKTPVENALQTMDEKTVQRLRFELGKLEDLPLGAVIGAVFVEDCIQIDADFRSKLSAEELSVGDFADGRFAWMLSEIPLELSDPIPCAGQQGFWEFSAVKELSKKTTRH